MEFKDYYKVLGVEKDASEDDIRKAFRKLARVHHPDVAKDKGTAEARFKEINEAYEVLKDPEKRKNYDELGRSWRPGSHGGFQPPPGYGRGTGRQPFEDFEVGGTGFSDFFERFFGGGFSGDDPRTRGHPRHGMPGSDVEIDFLVTGEQAIHGGTRQVTLRWAGSGETETYQVKIPSGVYEGQRIRLTGRGGKSASGGQPGDLYLRVKFQQHPDYLIRGSDLQMPVNLPPWQAVLGTELKLPTLDGTARLKVPAGTSSGKRFRVKGYGLPKEGGGRGDLYAEIEISIPTHLSAEERHLWEQLAKASAHAHKT